MTGAGRIRKKVLRSYEPETIEDQLIDCMDDITRVINGYHVAIRMTALKRVIQDEEHIVEKSYTFRTYMPTSKRKISKPPEDKMIV